MLGGYEEEFCMLLLYDMFVKDILNADDLWFIGYSMAGMLGESIIVS